MKTVLVAINAKFEHEGLAVWYLKAACNRRGIPVSVQQHSINDAPQKIYASILEEDPDVVAFSCYIWNRNMVEMIAADLKKARPGLILIAGGPEVGYESSSMEFRQMGVDFVLKGPGEGVFPDSLLAIEAGDRETVMQMETGIRCREEEGYISPFLPEYLSRISGRIAYIEASRGCPYHCSYCLSSESAGVSFHPLEEIREDIDNLVRAGAKVIKFVDRSFNVNRDHATAIWETVRQYDGRGVTFHFEVNPDRLTTDQLELMARMPRGLMQIEAGIQSTNPETLKAVSRAMDADKALENLRKVIAPGNIHVHADLIAGLPHEDVESFRTSFNKVYGVRPHHLQLGFLKLLRGTRIRREAEVHGYRYRDYPPYEVLASRSMDARDLLLLKGIEELVERFYNAGRLDGALDYVVPFFASPFDFYEQLYRWEKENNLLYQPVSPVRLFLQMKEFTLSRQPAVDPDILNAMLALDYVRAMKTTALPEALFPPGERWGFKVPDLRDYLDEALWRELGKSEARKRYIVLEGVWPEKKGEEFHISGNRMLVDTKKVDPVTGRAYAAVI